MQLTSFDDLISAGLAQPDPQRLLLLLLRAVATTTEKNLTTDGDSSGSGTLIPVMATDLELSDTVRLETIIDEADSLGHPWDLIMVSCLSGSHGHLPDTKEAEPYLQQMAEAIRNGTGLSHYAVFNRAGSPVSLQTL